MSYDMWQVWNQFNVRLLKWVVDTENILAREDKEGTLKQKKV